MTLRATLVPHYLNGELKMSNTILYIGTGRGLFKAEGDGSGFSVASVGLEESGGLRCPVILDKDDPRRMYAGTSRRGVFVSEDGGATWRESQQRPG